MKALTGTLIVALLAAGCMPAGPGAPTGSASSAPPTASPSTASLTPPPTASPTDEESPAPPPPAAFLRAGAGEPIAGDLGTVCWLGACGDSPWLPAPSVPLLELDAASRELTISIEDGFEFVLWSANYAAAEDTTGADTMPLANGGAEDGPTINHATFDAPPSGDWVVSVFLRYANEDGDGAYYWHVTVP